VCKRSNQCPRRRSGCSAASRFRWKGETALIHKEMLSRHLAILQGPIYYIAGPPTMVAAMRETLVSAGVEEDDIRAEEFAGY
jgi:Na+-transporting NADH:ubiquinone oxidoreductase subunit NqrF